MRSKKYIKYLVIVVGICVGGFFMSLDDDDKDFEIAKNLDIYYTLFRELNLYYVDDADPGKLVKKSIDEMLKSLDPYTVYYPESDIEDYKFMTTGQYGGIGSLIRKKDDYVMIAEPYEGSPTVKSGLKAGDVIVKVDGKTIKGKSTDDISKLLKGTPDTKLVVTIRRYGVDKDFDVNITRKKIQVKNVPYYGMLNETVGYIRLSSFTQNAGANIKDAFVELKEKGMKELVFDLRSNPGGLLHEAVNIVNLFIEKGNEIVTTKGKSPKWNTSYVAKNAPTDLEIPIVTLVSRSSASASEIVSGALQDFDRGVIIGQRTYGKGLVQTTRDISYNTKLKVTTAKYYIPSGRCIQALDYSNRNDDGSVGRVPDSLISEFATTNGRKVFDGGGVTPDIKIKQELLGNLAYHIRKHNIIFDYATVFASKNDSIASADSFELSDEQYKEFVQFVTEQEFEYESKTEEEIKELEKIAKKEKYYEIAKDEIEAIKIKLGHDLEKDLMTFSVELKQLLKEEIASRYYLQKGRTQALLSEDPAIDKAIEVLNDKKLYASILDGSYVAPIDSTEVE